MKKLNFLLTVKSTGKKKKEINWNDVFNHEVDKSYINHITSKAFAGVTLSFVLNIKISL